MCRHETSKIKKRTVTKASVNELETKRVKHEGEKKKKKRGKHIIEGCRGNRNQQAWQFYAPFLLAMDRTEGCEPTEPIASPCECHMTFGNGTATRARHVVRGCVHIAQCCK